VAGARRPIEECFGTTKDDLGLDNYQVRTWNAWHRHITLTMLAHTFTAITAHKHKKGLTKPPPPSPPHPTPPNPPPKRRRLIPLTLTEICRLLSINYHDHHAVTHALHWSTFRREHQADARRHHFQRRRRLQHLMI